LAIAAGLFLAALDTYVVVTVLPRMMFDLALPLDRVEQATPVITGFLVGYIVAMPLVGAVSDIHGRGRVYLASLAVFSIGSLLTATAGLTSFPSEGLAGLPWLVGGRVLQGLGGGALVPVALALAADLYPAGDRALPLGAIAAVQESGSVLGPLYGAALAGAASGLGGWRAIFWINLPLTALCAAGLVIAARRAPTASRVARGPGAHLDWLGGVLLGLGLALLVLALYPDDPTRHAVGALFAPFGLGAVVALSAYIWRQSRGIDPLIPRTLLRSRTFAGANLTNLLVGAALMVALVDVPVVARGIFGLSEFDGALLLARFMVAIPVGALMGGLISNRLGYRLTAVLGLALAALAFFRMSGWRADELGRQFLGLPDATLTLALCGLGFGLVIAPVAAAILDRAGAREHGLASSLVVLARSVGMLLGLSALTAFGIRRFYELLNQSPPPAISGDLGAQAAAIQARSAIALLEEYHEIFSITVGICLVAALVALATLSGGGRRRAAVAEGEA
jgi:MFS family permease